MINRRCYRLRLFRWLEQPPSGYDYEATAHGPPSPDVSWILTAEVISTRGFSGGAQRRPLEAVVRLRPRPSSRHAEDGEAQAPPDGEQPERNDHNHTRPKRART